MHWDIDRVECHYFDGEQWKVMYQPHIPDYIIIEVNLEEDWNDQRRV